MRAFEPEELEKVSIVKAPRTKVPVHEPTQHQQGSANRFVSLATSVGLICLIVLVLAVIAIGVGGVSSERPDQNQKHSHAEER